MKLFKYMKTYKTFQKMLISYMLIVALTISLVSWIAFQLFSYSSTLEINKISQTMLTQTSYAANVIYEQTFQVARQLIDDNEIISTLYQKQLEPSLNYRVSIKLGKIKGIYPFIHSLGIYNGITNSYVTNRGSLFEDKETIISLTQEKNESLYYTFFPRKINYIYNTRNPFKDVVTFILFPGAARNLPSKGAILINIDADYIGKTIQAIHSNYEDIILIIDRQGKVLSHTQSGQFLTDMSSIPYIREILNNKSDKGHMIEKIDDKKYLITFVRSGNLGWTFISNRNYEMILSNIHQLRNVILAIAMILIVIGFGMSFLITRNMYNPIKSLMGKISTHAQSLLASNKQQNEFEYLSDVFSQTLDNTRNLTSLMRKTSPALKETYFSFLLRGNIDELSETIKTIENVDSNLTGPSFSVLLFKIDDYAGFTSKNTIRDQSLLRFAISNIAQELLVGLFRNDVMGAQEDRVLILIQYDQDTLPNELFLILSEIGQVLENHFNLSISVGIGDCVTSKQQIHLSHKSAQETIQYRLYYGHGCVISSNDVREQSGKIKKYDTKLEKNIIEAIQVNHPDKLDATVANFIVSVSGLNYNNTLQLTHQLIISILGYFNNLVMLTNSDFEQYYNETYITIHIETLTNLQQFLLTFCKRLALALEEKNSHRHHEIIEQIENYIQAQYCNADLSLDLLASKFHFSSAYLSTLFKNATNKSVTDYINQIRLDKAIDLLVNTNEPSSKISEEVGILNNTYFFTLFKKTHGMTPTQYRKQHSK